MSETDTIADGERMKQIMDDELVKKAFAIVDQRATEKAITGATVEDREAGRAVVVALKQIAVEMRIVHDRGTVAKAERTRREQQEQARSARTPR